MGSLPKLLIVLTLLLPGGFFVAPLLVVMNRWRQRRAQPGQLPGVPGEQRALHSQAPA